MKPASFEFAKAETVSGVMTLLRDARLAGRKAGILAGGQHMLPMLRQRKTRVDLLIWIGKINELLQIIQEARGWRIGAAVTAMDLISRGGVFADIGRVAGPPSVRSRATIGGGIASAGATSDWLVRLGACGATCVVQRVDRTTERSIDDFVGAGRTPLSDGDIIREILLPAESQALALFADRVSRARNSLPDINMALAIPQQQAGGRVAVGLANGSFTAFDIGDDRLRAARGGRLQPADCPELAAFDHEGRDLAIALLSRLARYASEQDHRP